MAELLRAPLLDRLQDAGFTSCVLATYNIHFPFFESVVLRRLRAAGCQNVVVFVDATQLTAALGDRSLMPRLAGTEYTVIPVRVGGAFHPKVVMRIGKRKGSLFVGSHNLSFAGVAHNHEITTHFGCDAQERADAAAFQSVAAELRRHAASALPSMLEAFEAALREGEWIRATAPPSPGLRVLTSHAENRSLWTRIRELLGGSARRVLVVGPFFDPELAFLETLERDLRPTEPLVVAIEPGGVSIDVARAKRTTYRFVDVQGLPRTTKGELRDAYLHAKLIWVESDRGELLVAGSANPTVSGLLADVAHRNAEIVVARWSEGTSNALLTAVGLDEFLEAPELSATSWSQIEERLEDDPRLAPERTESRATLVAETTEGGFVIGDALSATVELRSAEATVIGTAVCERLAPNRSLARAAPDLRAATMFLVTDESPPRTILVHHSSEISELRSSDSKRALRSALGRLDEDPRQLEALLALTEKVIFDSGAVAHSTAQSLKVARDGDESPESTTEASESLAVEALGRHAVSTRPRRAIATGDIAVLLDALIRRLGVGLVDDRDAANAEVAERQASDDGDEDPPTDPDGAIDRDALARHCRRRTKLLVGRTLRQLARIVDQDAARTFIVQLAAVLSLMRALSTYARRREWRHVEEGLIDRGAIRDVLEVIPGRLAGANDGLIPQALECNDGTFDELDLVAGLIGWVSWEVDARDQMEAQQNKTARPRVSAFKVAQRALFLYPWLNAAAAEILADAVRRSSRPKLDHEKWLTQVLSYTERARQFASGELAPGPGIDAVAGDLVVLPAHVPLRVRIALSVERAGRGKVLVDNPGGESSGWVADRIERL